MRVTLLTVLNGPWIRCRRLGVRFHSCFTLKTSVALEFVLTMDGIGLLKNAACGDALLAGVLIGLLSVRKNSTMHLTSRRRDLSSLLQEVVSCILPVNLVTELSSVPRMSMEGSILIRALASPVTTQLRSPTLS